MWTGYAWHKQRSPIRQMVEDPIGKRSLRKPKLKDCIEKDIKTMRPEISLREVVEYRL